MDTLGQEVRGKIHSDVGHLKRDSIAQDRDQPTGPKHICVHRVKAPHNPTLKTQPGLLSTLRRLGGWGHLNHLGGSHPSLPTSAPDQGQQSSTQKYRPLLSQSLEESPM